MRLRGEYRESKVVCRVPERREFHGKRMPGICERKEPSKRIPGNSANIHTRLVIVLVSISHTGKPHNTQELKCKNIKNIFALVVGEN